MTGFLAFFSSMSVDNWFNNVLIVLGAIGTGLVFWLKGKDNLRQGEVGFVLRNGKVRLDKNGNPRERGPGLILLIPWFDTLWRISSQERTQNLGQKTRKIVRNGVVQGYEEIETVVFYQVVNAEKALYVSQNLDGQVTSICNKHLQTLIGKGRSNAMIARIFSSQVQSELSKYGVQFNELLFESAKDSYATQLARSLAAVQKTALLPFIPQLDGSLNGNGNGNHHQIVETL